MVKSRLSFTAKSSSAEGQVRESLLALPEMTAYMYGNYYLVVLKTNK